MPLSNAQPASQFVPVSLRRFGFPDEGEYRARMFGKLGFIRKRDVEIEEIFRGENLIPTKGLNFASGLR